MQKQQRSDESQSQPQSQSESPQLAHLAPANQQQSQSQPISHPPNNPRIQTTPNPPPPTQSTITNTIATINTINNAITTLTNTAPTTLFHPHPNNPNNLYQPQLPPTLPNPISNNRLSTQYMNVVMRTQERPRLVIDRIVLENFKSYADVQTIGPFHENFTSVVGPNGSGKSNLIQCMLFIFGYKANWMRLNRLNQLIHNSSTMPNLDKASVQVFFKKILQTSTPTSPPTTTQLPSSTFSIKRTVKSTGTSKYHINDQESTQTEVKELLQKQGIDLNNNRFLILQGEVEQISQMRQKSGDRDKPGLLEYLEDIIGSGEYIQRIQGHVAEYNRVEETKHEKGELMKLAEIQLKGMNKGKQQAIKFVKKQRQIYQIHNILQQVTISNNNYESSQYSQKLLKAESQKQRIISQQKQKLKKQAQRFRQIKKTKTEIEHIQKQLQKQNEIMMKMEMTDKNINQDISFKSQDLVRYQRKNDQFDGELGRIIRETGEVKGELPGLREKLGGLKTGLEAMEEELAKHDKPHLKNRLKSLQIQLKKLDHQLKTFTQKHTQTKKTHTQKHKSTQSTQIQKVQLQYKLTQQSQILQKITYAEQQARKIKQNLNKELQHLSQTRKQYVMELEQIGVSLKERLVETREMGIFNDMFEKIMGQGIDGVIGRLGDLGTVPKQYDQIITSCCNRLDNIVVRDMEAATAVLSFLKSSKLGRVTCIILDKIHEHRKYMQKPFQPLPNSIRLFDCITPQSQQIKLAFYFAISDTIYCENSQLGLEYSMKDQRNRRRVISRKPGGFIIYELNGLMNGCLARSGGFAVRARNRMRKDGVDNNREIQDMQKSKLQLTQKISKLQQKYRNVKKQHENVHKDLQQFKHEKRTVQTTITQTKYQLAQLQKSTNNSIKSAEEQKNKIEKELESLAGKIRELEELRKGVVDQIRGIQDEQRLSQTEKISRMRDQYKISKQEYIQLDKDIQKKVAILQTSIKRVQQNKKNKADINKKIEILNRQIQKLQKQRQQIQIKGTETFNKIKSNQQKIKKLKKQQQQLKALFEEQEKEVRQSKIKIQKAKLEVQQCREKIEIYRKNIYEAEEELKKERETYRELSATYDFLEDIDKIQFMSVDQVKRNVDGHAAKGDTSVILNTSIDSNNTSMSKVFPLEKLLQVSPFENLSEQRLDPFLLFTDKLRTMLVTESQNLKKMSGNNLQIISEFRNKFSDFKKKHEQFEAVKNSQMQLKRKIEQLKKQRLDCFIKGFSIINSKLKEVYQLLTRGGDAELQLTDSLDPFSDGITFSVRPPKKAWKQINKLSGGQKTLSSLSLIFALHYFKPTPLYFMDQIDAALDFKNVSIVADYIKKRTRDAQFIIISLRNNMFQLADKLVGVYKTYDKTKIIHFVPTKMRKNPSAALDKQNQDNNKNI